MAINLDQVRTEDSAGSGNVTNTSAFTGDVDGTRDNGLTVTGLRGVTLNDTNAPQLQNQGYVYNITDSDFK